MNLCLCSRLHVRPYPAWASLFCFIWVSLSPPSSIIAPIAKLIFRPLPPPSPALHFSTPWPDHFSQRKLRSSRVSPPVAPLAFQRPARFPLGNAEADDSSTWELKFRDATRLSQRRPLRGPWFAAEPSESKHSGSAPHPTPSLPRESESSQVNSGKRLTQALKPSSLRLRRFVLLEWPQRGGLWF